jgi:hypothetical protein
MFEHEATVGFPQLRTYRSLTVASSPPDVVVINYLSPGGCLGCGEHPGFGLLK